MALICSECGAATFEQLKVVNNGISPGTVECLVCGNKWPINQDTMSRGDLPGKSTLPSN